MEPCLRFEDSNLERGGLVTSEFLTWFLIQKPFRKFSLVTKSGIEHAVDRLDHINVIGDGRVLLGKDLGMGRTIVFLSEVEEIRQ